jgi:hypothetical protein
MNGSDPGHRLSSAVFASPDSRTTPSVRLVPAGAQITIRREDAPKPFRAAHATLLLPDRAHRH